MLSYDVITSRKQLSLTFNFHKSNYSYLEKQNKGNRDMDDTKWNDIDKSSRELVKAFFIAVKADKIEDSHGNCSYDLKV